MAHFDNVAMTEEQYESMLQVCTAFAAARRNTAHDAGDAKLRESWGQDLRSLYDAQFSIAGRRLRRKAGDL